MRNFSKKDIFVILLIVIIFFLLILPVFSPVYGPSNIYRCQKNLRQIGIALKSYQIEYGNKIYYPDANGGSFVARTYSTEILPEAKIYHCPATEDEINPQKLRSVGLKRGRNSGDPNEINATSYAGRKNALDPSYRLFRINRDIAITTIASDDIHQPIESYNHGNYNCFLFLDGHTEEHLISEKSNLLLYPLMN